MAFSQVRSMTEGSIPKLLWGFAAPMMVGNLFQQLYNMVDSVVVGNFVGGYSLGAIGACSSLNFMTFGFCNGVSLGVGVVIAQLFGADRREEIRRTIFNGALVLLALSLVFTAVCMALAAPLLRLLQTPEEYVDESIRYYQITCAGIVGVAAYNTIASMLRALGDSKTPLLFLILASLLNVGLDLVMVLWFRLGVAGVAIATIIAQAVSAVSCIAFAVRTNPYFRLTAGDRRLDGRRMLQCLRIGIPVGLQNSLISFSSVMLQRVVNSFGPDAATAYTMTVRLEQLIQQPYASLSAAISSFAGQNLGARQLQRVRRGVGVGALAVLAFSAGMWLALHFFGRPVLGIFGDNPDILDIAVRGLSITSCFYAPLGMIYLIRGLSNGAGDSTQAMLNGVVEIACRLGFAVALTRISAIGMWGIWMTTAATWTVTALECGLRYRQGKWKRVLLGP